MKNFSLFGFIVRLLGSMLVIAITNILTPWMSNDGGFLNLALIAIVIAIVSQVFSSVFGLSKAGRGLSDFLVMALILYISGLLLNKFNVTLLGALIGGLIYGLVEALFPVKKL